jgi:hypothetical protein
MFDYFNKLSYKVDMRYGIYNEEPEWWIKLLAWLIVLAVFYNAGKWVLGV